MDAALEIVHSILNHRIPQTPVTEARPPAAGAPAVDHGLEPARGLDPGPHRLPDHRHGRSNVPAAGPVIFAGNHISYLDGPVMFGASPRPMHILVKQEMFKGFLGRVLKASGQLPVDRAGDRAALNGQARARRRAVRRDPARRNPGERRRLGDQQRGGLARAELRRHRGPRGHPGHPGRRRAPGHRSPAAPAAACQLRRGPQRQPQARRDRPCFNGQGGNRDPRRAGRAMSRTPSKAPGSPCPTRIPRKNVMKQ